ncbi:MAG: DUF3347 domain-containing protein [Candidatus Eiseniibacteriota bacterium]|nr:MAG: DUF3347 domain-containing protein [Candidatus Eisenbacteria bacterium]
MRKSNLTLAAIVAVLAVLLTLAGPLAATASCGSCSSTCGAGASKTSGKKAHQCSGEKAKGASHEEASWGFLTSYFEMRSVLAGDEVEGLDELSKNLVKDTKKFRQAMTEKKASSEQLKALKEIENSASTLKVGKASQAEAERLKVAREGFRAISRHVLAYVETYGFDRVAYSYYCPMAKDSWLQETDKVGNPYYGSEMLKCGKMTGHVMDGKYVAVKEQAEKGMHEHH